MFNETLTCSAVQASDGSLVGATKTHNQWIVTSQDCSLAQENTRNNEPAIELRPVLTTDPPPYPGIRSRKFKLLREPKDRRYCDDHESRLMISAEALALIDAKASGRFTLASDRRAAFKVWLGQRYARAAVPAVFEDLAKAIIDAVGAHRHDLNHSKIIDLFWDADNREGLVPTYDLFALIEADAIVDDVREWLYAIASSISRELGEIRRVEAGTEAALPIAILTRTYLLASALTWGR